MADEQLFRFGAIREPESAPGRTTGLRVRTYSDDDPTPFFVQLMGAAPAERVILAEDHLEAIGQQGTRMHGAPQLVWQIDQFLLERSDRASAVELRRFIDAQLSAMTKSGGDPDLPSNLPDLVGSPRLRQDRYAYGDTLIAAALAPYADPEIRLDVTRILLLLGIIEWITVQRSASATELRAQLIEGVILLPPALFNPWRVDGSPKPDREPPQEPPPSLIQISRYAAAIDSLRGLAREPMAMSVELIGPNGDSGSDESDALATAVANAESWVLDETRMESLSPEVQTVLVDLDIGPGTPVPEAVATLRQRSAEEYQTFMLDGPVVDPGRSLANELLRFRPETTTIAGPMTIDAGTGPFVRPPAIGDLNVVRQTLLRYERGEVAHVENVLAKEARKRALTVVDLREEQVTNVREEEEERTFDSQTTARNEMEKETTHTQQEDQRLNVGGSISAQYGPWVKATVTAGYAKGSSTAESIRNASRYAKDVTDRSARRVRLRTEETRRTLTRHEATERNSHSFNNTGTEHVTGIYRWVNKIYRAQVFNYGKRLLLELVVPDPSVNVRYAAGKGAGLGVGVEPPPPLALPENPAVELQPSMITGYNWQALAGYFKVSGLTPPPNDLATVTLPLVSDQSPIPEQPTAPQSGSGGSQPSAPPPNTVLPAVYKSSRELAVPAGYFPLGFTACVINPGSGTLTSRLGQLLKAAPLNTDITALPAVLSILTSLIGSVKSLEGLTLAVGPTMLTVGVGAYKIRAPFNWGQIGGQPADILVGSADGPMAVGAATEGAGFALTLTVRCELTVEAFQRWQQRSYEAIVQAHAAWESDYRASVSAAIAAAGVLFGTNPLDKAEIVRIELQRSAISLMSPTPRDTLRVVSPGNPSTNAEPTTNRAGLVQAARVIEFYEQSFEWPQMAWMMYPYFWTGRADWPEASRRTDQDPAFAQFLRAGAARVVLPVRPGFERVVCTVLGLRLPEAWPTSPSPMPNSEPWLSISEEIRSATEVPAGKPVGKAWRVTIPTTLVILDDAGSDLPILAK